VERLQEIVDRYWPRSVRPQTMGYIAPVLAPLDATRFLADCLESGHALLGVSGFNYLDSEFIQPEQGFELDRASFGSESEFLGRVGQVLMGEVGRSVVFELAFEE
jgi:hypothetical protein